MAENSTIQEYTIRRINEFGLPSWVEAPCPFCGKRLRKIDVMSIEIHLTPMFLGNISVSYHCKSCQSATILHNQLDLRRLCDFLEAMENESPNLKDYNDLIRSGTHNARNKVWNLMQGS